jgi:CubicO group peptidase (beta-lactamase class C family)
VSGLDAARLERLRHHFDAYVEDGRLPGYLVTIARDGEPAYEAMGGRRDMEADLPVERDTIWRIFSMTKPIASVAAMLLWEEGRFELKDPIARWLPEFAEPRVFTGGAMAKVQSVAAIEPIRMWHLLTHTSGLTYGFHHHGAVDALYREAGHEWGTPPGMDLAACCAQWAKLPLLFQPGTEWNYGVSTDVLGRVVEVISGQPLDEFLAARVLGPLGMADTAFSAPEADHGRLAALYVPDPETGLATRSPLSDRAMRPPDMLSGGGGLVSTAGDYARLTRMLINGGELDGVRLLGPRTLRLMTSNQLPGHADLERFGRPLFAETTFDGVGFGLGFSVVEDPVAARYTSSRGEFGWGGAASTAFWVDREERMEVAFFEHASDPLPAAPAGAPGADRLTSSARMRFRRAAGAPSPSIRSSSSTIRGERQSTASMSSDELSIRA